MITRLLIGAVGVAAAVFGGLRFAEIGPHNAVQAGSWLVGGVVAHDAILAPATIAVTLLARAVVPVAWRARAALALVVLGTVTVTAVPVLGRWGARPDNPTLLDRDYLAGWLVFAALVLLVTLAGARWPAHSTAHGKD